jgi:hypothetical protein
MHDCCFLRAIDPWKEVSVLGVEAEEVQLIDQ